ncbi:11307_t:CDS:1, partial [Entrophospora sp. SA101]
DFSHEELTSSIVICPPLFMTPSSYDDNYYCFYTTIEENPHE